MGPGDKVFAGVSAIRTKIIVLIQSWVAAVLALTGVIKDRIRVRVR